jgi:dihydrofolate reductase
MVCGRALYPETVVEVAPMRRIVVSEFLTLDGVMQGPGSADEDREGGFDLGGWHLPFAQDEAQMKAIGAAMAATDTYLFGRKTYEIMAAYWPNQPDTDMFAAALNPRPKHVVSRTLREPLPWQYSSLIGDDVVERIIELKRGPGKDISVLGSGELVGTLLRHGLVDELSLTVDPIVLGSGKRLFRDGLSPSRFQLVGSVAGDNDVVMLTYRLPDQQG